MGSGGMKRKRRRHLPKVQGHGHLADGSNWFGGGAYGARPWGASSRTVHHRHNRRTASWTGPLLVAAVVAGVLVVWLVLR